MGPLAGSVRKLGARFGVNTITRKTVDRAAISLAVVCGLHCLATPILIVALPIIATTFWVDENFHLWMLLFVIPTTTLAIWSGCRRHKDKWVVVSAALGLGILVSALIAERIEHAHDTEAFQVDAHKMAAETGEAASSKTAVTESLTWYAWLNTLGGCLLIAGHTRNFLLCRKDNCTHDQSCEA